MEGEPKISAAPTATREETIEEAGKKDFKGLDDASKFLAGREEITWTEDEEKRLLWKIDRWLLPLVRGRLFCNLPCPLLPADL